MPSSNHIRLVRILVGIVALGLVLIWGVFIDGFNKHRDGSIIDWVVIVGLLSLPLLQLSFLPFQQRAAQREAEEIYSCLQRKDKTALPVLLFLRSFDVAHSTISMRIASGLTHKLTQPSWAPQRYDAEQELADAIGSRGQLLAIGDKKLSYGAGKVLVSDDVWQATFAQLVDAAKIIFILPGPTSSTLWEIAQIRENASLLQRAVWIMPREGTMAGGDDDKLWDDTIDLIFRRVGVTLPAYTETGCYFRIYPDLSSATVGLDSFTPTLKSYLKENAGKAGGLDVDELWQRAVKRDSSWLTRGG